MDFNFFLSYDVQFAKISLTSDIVLRTKMFIRINIIILIEENNFDINSINIIHIMRDVVTIMLI